MISLFIVASEKLFHVYIYLKAPTLPSLHVFFGGFNVAMRHE